MQKYLVLGYIKSNLSYDDIKNIIVVAKEYKDLQVQIGKTDLEISNDEDNVDDLQVVVSIESSSIMEAIFEAQSIAESIANKIAFVSNGRVEKCIFYKAISKDEDKSLREFLQFDYEILSNIARRKVNINDYLELVNKEKTIGKSKERIERAIMFYQKAVISKSFLEKFNNYWITLECLTPILDEIYPESIEVRKCKKCGNEEQVRNTASLKMFFDKELGNSKLYSGARRIRVSFLHGLNNIINIEKDISEIIEELEECTYKTICILLGKNKDRQPDIADIDEGLTFQLYMKISNVKVFNDENKPIFPNFKVKMEISEVNDELCLHPIVQADFLNKGGGFASIGWECYGTCGRDIKKIQLTLESYKNN